MRPKNYILISLTFALVYSLTGCYTQVATNEPEPYSTTTIYKQSPDSDNYYSEDGEQLDSSYYSEVDPDTDESVTIINKYYNDYPYNYFDYAFLPIGIGIGWYWGWTSFYSYSYWPYYPYYYSGWWGCGYPTPYYGYYSGYNYYDPYYCYGGYYPNYGYGNGYGYYPRDEYVTRTRNNSGGRNYPEYERDPLVTTSNGSIYKGRDNLNLGKDVTVDRNRVTDSNLEIQKRTIETTRQVVGVTDANKIKNTRTDDISSNDITRTKQTRNDKSLGLDREVTTKKSLGSNNRNDVSKQNVKTNTAGNYSDQINKNNRIGNETKKIFGKENTNRQNTKQNVRTNNNTKQPNVKNNHTPKKENNTRTYTPPKQNSNPPRSYSPPSSNNSPRSYSPPSGNSGSNNSGNRRR
jgi:hypothetical protein